MSKTIDENIIEKLKKTLHKNDYLELVLYILKRDIELKEQFIEQIKSDISFIEIGIANIKNKQDCGSL